MDNQKLSFMKTNGHHREAMQGKRVISYHEVTSKTSTVHVKVFTLSLDSLRTVEQTIKWWQSTSSHYGWDMIDDEHIVTRCACVLGDKWVDVWRTQDEAWRGFGGRPRTEGPTKASGACRTPTHLYNASFSSRDSLPVPHFTLEYSSWYLLR